MPWSRVYAPAAPGPPHRGSAPRRCRSYRSPSLLLALPEQAELRGIARGLSEAEMSEGVRGQQPAARGALQIAALDQERLDDVLDGVARLRQRRRHGLDADRAAAVVQRNRREITPVHGIEAGGIDLQRAQRVIGDGTVDRACVRRECKVAHAAE